MKLFRNWMLAGAMTTLLMASCNTEEHNNLIPENYSNTIVLQWDEIAYKAFGGAAYQHSLMASRINAMTHLAMHDALNAIHPKFARYAFTGEDKKADPLVAAAIAAYTVLVHEIPDKKPFLDSALQISLLLITEGDAKTRGIQLGESAGKAIIQKRLQDGSEGDPLSPIPPSIVPGVYQAVPPFDFVFAPYWQNMKLFGLQKKDQFRSSQPPALGSAEYATAFEEVKEKGRGLSTVRTEDETAYAYYWYEFSEAGWNRVARVIAVNEKLGLWETSRMFALVDIAMADAYIAGWDSKFHYNMWRPYTAIRRADTDENELTNPDAQWASELPTPPVQDYPSTHSVLGNAAATVLARLVGDDTAFTMGSPTAIPAGGTRSFTKLSQAAQENADSRVMAGIHFRFACDAGMEMGEKIGNWVVDHHLKAIQ